MKKTSMIILAISLAACKIRAYHIVAGDALLMRPHNAIFIADSIHNNKWWAHNQSYVGPITPWAIRKNLSLELRGLKYDSLKTKAAKIKQPSN